jgi:hypothetical protein
MTQAPDFMASRAITMLGMHRSGTSLVTRGISTLGIHIGENLIDKGQDNPTGFWEDKSLHLLSERVMKFFALKWNSTRFITPGQWGKKSHQEFLDSMRAEAVAYFRTHFAGHRLCGFKNPLTIQLLPFWRPVFDSLDRRDDYVVIVRNPRSVAASLQKRNAMKEQAVHLLWLAYMANLHYIRGKKFVVVDYDLFMADPDSQLKRIAQQLDIPVSEEHAAAIRDFSDHFVNRSLQHTVFCADGCKNPLPAAGLSHQAYDLLRQRACDSIDNDSFWRQWLDLQLDRKVTGARVMFSGASPKQILKNLVWCWNQRI